MMQNDSPLIPAASHPATPRPWRLGLQGRIVAVLLLVSLLPLALTGIGSWIVFGRLLEAKALELHRQVVATHSAAIQLYLDERQQALTLAARLLPTSAAADTHRLEELFELLNESYDDAFVDLGVIAADGTHLAYVGPYALQDKNYAQTEWFRTVLERGADVSDVFLGFRDAPHCVVAVIREAEPRPWILRATINSAQFDALVSSDALGATGDAVVINGGGIYQTPPRVGRVLDRWSAEPPTPHRGLRERRLDLDGRGVVQTTTWLNQGRWMLVVQQDLAEIAAPVRQAMLAGGVVVLLAVVLLVTTTVLATRHLTNRIARANARTKAIGQDLLRSAKLASLGELATGLAHEINNPLAIISAEQTNIDDLTRSTELDAVGEEILESSQRCQRQVTRCAAITRKMLQFGRGSGAPPQPTDIGPCLEEIVALLRRQAEVRNVELRLMVEDDLPRAVVDRTELEQVLVNLINNSLQAIHGAGRITVRADQLDGAIQLAVHDSGGGIQPEDLERIFQPFFTTKPVGQGTGLGLAVCYGIVRSWGGRLEAESTPGRGTTMTVYLPVAASSHDESER